MKTLLYIDACIRGENSRTKRIAERLITAASAKDGTEIQTVCLEKMRLSPLNNDTLTARNDLLSRKKYDDPMFALARQFAQARGIVVAAPYWDLSFPSALRVYIEQIMVSGIAFHYNRVGAMVGDCKAMRLAYITTRGGEVDDSVLATTDFGTMYMKAVCSMLNIPRFSPITAEGLDIVGNDVEKILWEAETEATLLGTDFWAKDV